MKIHDKYVIELKEVIRGYGNDPMSHSLLPCDYKFYEIDGVAICEESFKKMTPLQTEIIKVLEDINAEIADYSYVIDDEGYAHVRKHTHIWDAKEFINRKIAEMKGDKE